MRRSIVLLPLIALFSQAALAHDYNLGDLHIDHPWARAMPTNAVNGAAYLTVHNRGPHADQLISASSTQAERVELHNHVHHGDLMRMQKVEAVSLPAGGEAVLAPGGYHLMLFGLKAPLNDGESFPLTLEFAEAGPVEVQIKVQAQEPSHTQPSHHGHH